MLLSKFINQYFFNKPDTIDEKYTIDNINKDKDKNNLKEGDIILASISTTVIENGKKKRLNNLKNIYQIVKIYDKFILRDALNQEYKTSKSGIKLINYFSTFKKEEKEKFVNDLINRNEQLRKNYENNKYLEEVKYKKFNFLELPPDEKLRRIIDSGIKNIWMVGPAGCGKSTIARNLAESMNLPYLCISCGIGTSATEFIGYKYPTREATRFSEYYSKPSVILIDEITALDACVAQVLNAALANDEIETTTGLVHRNPECIIIATSNTFGSGCDRQYVANNQLDASTIDRFIGGILEINYSDEYEAKYDKEVVDFIKTIRCFIKEYNLRRIASTRMIQAGTKLKYSFVGDWKKQLLINWSEDEFAQFEDFCKNKKIELVWD